MPKTLANFDNSQAILLWHYGSVLSDEMLTVRANPYFWVPIVAPICGAMTGAWLYINVLGRQVEPAVCATPGCEISIA